jgi:hypothetical protein
VDAYIIELGKPQAVLFDIDGTISSAEHRGGDPRKTIISDWSKFHGLMVLDQPIQHTVDKLIAHKRNGQKVVLLSMRPERFRRFTERWLSDMDIPYDALYLRPSADYRKGNDVKRAIYEKEIEPQYDVVHAYDDRDDIVKMWRDMGLNASKVTDPGLPPFEGGPVPDPRPVWKPKSHGGKLVYVRAHENRGHPVKSYFRKGRAVSALASKLGK